MDIRPLDTVVNYTKPYNKLSVTSDPSVIRFPINPKQLNIGKINSIAIEEFNCDINVNTVGGSLADTSDGEPIVLRLEYFDEEEGTGWNDELTLPDFSTPETKDEKDDKYLVISKKRKRSFTSDRPARKRKSCPCASIKRQPKTRLLCPHGFGQARKSEIAQLGGNHFVAITLSLEELIQLKTTLYRDDVTNQVDILQPEAIISAGKIAHEFLSRKYNWQRFMNSLADTPLVGQFLTAYEAHIAAGGAQLFTPDYTGGKPPFLLAAQRIQGETVRKIGFELNNSKYGFRFSEPGVPPGTDLAVDQYLKLLGEEDFTAESLTPKVFDGEPWNTALYQCRFVPYISEKVVKFLFPENVDGEVALPEQYDTPFGTNNNNVEILNWRPTSDFDLSEIGYQNYWECFDTKAETTHNSHPWLWGSKEGEETNWRFRYALPANSTRTGNPPAAPTLYKLMQIGINQPGIRGAYTNIKEATKASEFDGSPNPIQIYLTATAEVSPDDSIEVNYLPQRLIWSALGANELDEIQNIEIAVKLVTDSGVIRDVELNDPRNFVSMRLVFGMR